MLRVQWAREQAGARVADWVVELAGAMLGDGVDAAVAGSACRAWLTVPAIAKVKVNAAKHE